ncbi:sodium:proton antiporter [Roseomonas sp. OT10]|uniref:sodium:proton antiporter n=1 Tax=Roseomonas cutis TaxID=2897332 RepID=UPI001E47D6DF|nr:sodium:proton antiporter [Roseomonas sp. OT10]UFN50353.1 sodium:proton antiporter [Roseomonas sp. OT10]
MPAALAGLAVVAAPAFAAAEPPAGGAGLSLLWGLPFAGLLLSIALLPLLAARLWHHHYGKVAAGWALALLLPFAALAGAGAAFHLLAHVLLGEYLPFLALLLALYATGGGVLLRGTLVGTPVTNTALLAAGMAAASVMGTTGASMLMIRPLLRANAFRRHRTHTVVFFIFLVANLGGSLTPLGDPPLYLGFLRGVSFFWPVRHLLPPFLFCAGLLLLLYFLLDRRAFAREAPMAPALAPHRPLRVEGLVNLALLGVVVGTVLLQGVWQPGRVIVLGQPMGVERLLAVAVFLAVAWASVRLTPASVREANGFGWGAMIEVAKLFAAIFVTMAPVLLILQAGASGAAAPLVALTEDALGRPVPWVYFWLTGALSSFLDNAPTYLVFFELAGGDPAWLMGPGARILAAISCGAVFMGANSYIGNAPNLMVKAIAEGQGTPMPSFFGYCGWAAVVLLPVFFLATLIFF